MHVCILCAKEEWSFKIYMFIYIRTYVHTYIHTCIHTYIKSLYVSTCIYELIFRCMWFMTTIMHKCSMYVCTVCMYVYIYMYVCMYVCILMYVWMNVCMYVCMYVCMWYSELKSSCDNWQSNDAVSVIEHDNVSSRHGRVYLRDSSRENVKVPRHSTRGICRLGDALRVIRSKILYYCT